MKSADAIGLGMYVTWSLSTKTHRKAIEESKQQKWNLSFIYVLNVHDK